VFLHATCFEIIPAPSNLPSWPISRQSYFQTVVGISHRLARPLHFQSVMGELFLFQHSQNQEIE
jgi:hypothetical protein